MEQLYAYMHLALDVNTQHWKDFLSLRVFEEKIPVI